MDFESLTLHRQGAVAEVELRGPGRGNAMGPAFWDELPKAFDLLGDDPEVRAIVLYGSGADFSFGLDLKGMMGTLGPHLAGAQLAHQRLELLAFIERLQRSFERVARCKKPVVAAISGWCIGGGVDLVTACDIRVCSADAKFSVREVKLAIVADLGTLQRLSRIVGEGAARELALTGRDIDAARAEHLGLVNHVLPDRDAALAEARVIAAEIAANSPVTVQGTKRVMDFSQDHPTADGLAYVAAWNAAFLQSTDLAEAVAAFFEKRPPKF